MFFPFFKIETDGREVKRRFFLSKLKKDIGTFEGWNESIFFSNIRKLMKDEIFETQMKYIKKST